VRRCNNYTYEIKCSLFIKSIEGDTYWKQYVVGVEKKYSDQAIAPLSHLTTRGLSIFRKKAGGSFRYSGSDMAGFFFSGENNKGAPLFDYHYVVRNGAPCNI